MHRSLTAPGMTDAEYTRGGLYHASVAAELRSAQPLAGACVCADGTVLCCSGGGVMRLVGREAVPVPLPETVRAARGLCSCPSGDVIVADAAGHCLWLLRSWQGRPAVRLLAGRPDRPGFVDGAAASAMFDRPWCVSATPDGSLVAVADSGNNAVRIYSAAAGTVATVRCGGGLQQPLGVAWLPQGALAVADTANHCVRALLPPEGGGDWRLRTVAGRPREAGCVDGSSHRALLHSPTSVAAARSGALLVADTRNDRVRVVADGAVYTLAGAPHARGVRGVRVQSPVCVLAVGADDTVLVTAARGRTIHRFRKEGDCGGVGGWRPEGSVRVLLGAPPEEPLLPLVTAPASPRRPPERSRSGGERPAGASSGGGGGDTQRRAADRDRGRERPAAPPTARLRPAGSGGGGGQRPPERSRSGERRPARSRSGERRRGPARSGSVAAQPAAPRSAAGPSGGERRRAERSRSRADAPADRSRSRGDTYTARRARSGSGDRRQRVHADPTVSPGPRLRPSMLRRPQRAAAAAVSAAVAVAVCGLEIRFRRRRPQPAPAAQPRARRAVQHEWADELRADVFQVWAAQRQSLSLVRYIRLLAACSLMSPPCTLTPAAAEELYVRHVGGSDQPMHFGAFVRSLGSVAAACRFLGTAEAATRKLVWEYLLPLGSAPPRPDGSVLAVLHDNERPLALLHREYSSRGMVAAEGWLQLLRHAGICPGMLKRTDAVRAAAASADASLLLSAAAHAHAPARVGLSGGFRLSFIGFVDALLRVAERLFAAEAERRLLPTPPARLCALLRRLQSCGRVRVGEDAAELRFDVPPDPLAGADPEPFRPRPDPAALPDADSEDRRPPAPAPAPVPAAAPPPAVEPSPSPPSAGTSSSAAADTGAADARSVDGMTVTEAAAQIFSRTASDVACLRREIASLLQDGSGPTSRPGSEACETAATAQPDSAPWPSRPPSGRSARRSGTREEVYSTRSPSFSPTPSRPHSPAAPSRAALDSEATAFTAPTRRGIQRTSDTTTFSGTSSSSGSSPEPAPHCPGALRLHVPGSPAVPIVKEVAAVAGVAVVAAAELLFDPKPQTSDEQLLQRLRKLRRSLPFQQWHSLWSVAEYVGAERRLLAADSARAGSRCATTAGESADDCRAADEIAAILAASSAPAGRAPSDAVASLFSWAAGRGDAGVSDLLHMRFGHRGSAIVDVSMYRSLVLAALRGAERPPTRLLYVEACAVVGGAVQHCHKGHFLLQTGSRTELRLAVLSPHRHSCGGASVPAPLLPVPSLVVEMSDRAAACRPTEDGFTLTLPLSAEASGGEEVARAVHSFVLELMTEGLDGVAEMQRSQPLQFSTAVFPSASTLAAASEQLRDSRSAETPQCLRSLDQSTLRFVAVCSPVRANEP